MKNGKPQVLVIDDQESIGIGVSDLLNSYDYMSDYVLSAESGLLFLKNNNDFDIVLLDINLGEGLSGPEAIPEILKNFKYVQIIMLTSHDTLEMGIECMKKGAFDFMSKPFDEEIFFEKASHALNKKKLLITQDLLIQKEKESAEQNKYLSSIYSHDVKNNAINSIFILRSLRDKCTSPEELKMLDVIIYNEEKILRTCGNIINIFYQTEISLNKKNTDIKEYFNVIIKNWKTKFDNKNISFNFKDCPGKFFIDSEYVNLAIENILSNALDNTSENGSFSIDVNNDGKFFIISFKNSGKLISSELRDKLFNKDLSLTKRSAYNKGLGLPFCKLAFEMHGGSINYIANDKDEINEFLVKIPT